jgi:hypothetical protein
VNLLQVFVEASAPMGIAESALAGGPARHLAWGSTPRDSAKMPIATPRGGTL